MYKKIIILMLSIIIAGCATISTDLDFYLKNYNIPEKYTVNQVYDDSGFAGVSSDKWEFTIANDGITSGGKKPIQMEEKIAYIKNTDFVKQGLPIDKNKICFYHEQWGVVAEFVCFKDNTLFYHYKLDSNGNHESIITKWQTMPPEFLDHSICSRETNIFCDLFANAIDYDPEICTKIEDKIDYCEKVLKKMTR